VLCTPPGPTARPHPAVLAAARLCGVDEVYCLGGAHAIAALAYGTASVPRVAKIFGPGNAWVEAAKSLVARDPEAADCDLVAGPSELVVVADRSADADLVVADLLAQCEHGADSQVLLLTDSVDLAAAVARRAPDQLDRLPRAAIARRSLAHGAAIVVDSLETAFEIVDRYAPEHLSLHLERPRRWLDRIHNAGAVFLGSWTPEALGDYCSGANHVLPTGGLARTRGGLAVADFQQVMTVQEATPAGLRALAAVASRLATAETLEGHRRSVAMRLERLDEDAA
jgi:histidinol dehydrogenase